ncbi:uncharacterized protein [Salminus brasiliensis]|uniref:uncharacterized protein n=1 Tax=Salminus brasiliensis TaxID=930266 RepID=UPI003B82C76A
MPVQGLPYKPQNLEEDKVLCDKLRKQGTTVIEKRLAKIKKGTFPTNGSPAKCSEWWEELKEGKKKAKYAMTIMASEYEPMVKQLDRCRQKVLGLESKIQSQEEAINMLKRTLQAQEEENKCLRKCNEQNKWLKLNLQAGEEEIKRLKRKCDSNEEEIDTLKQIRDSNEEEIDTLNQIRDSNEEEIDTLKQIRDSNEEEIDTLKQIRDFNEEEIDTLKQIRDFNEEYIKRLKQTRDSNEEEIDTLKLKLEQMQISQNDLDLEPYNFNYEFRKKTEEWVAIRAPKQEVMKERDSIVPYNSAQMERVLFELHECVSKALGPGERLFSLYHLSNPLYLLSVVNNADQEYKDICIDHLSSYAHMLSKAVATEKRKLEAERKNQCLHCGKKGHIQKRCRKPGGGAEVGPNDCFRCGKHGHWARHCMM